MSFQPPPTRKAPMKSRIETVHLHYFDGNQPQAAKETCNSCILVAAAASIGIIIAMLVILFC